MRKIKKSLVALLLLVSVMLSFASCQYIDAFLNRDQLKENSEDTKNESGTKNEDRIVPQGYTGGIARDLHFHYEYAVYWLETYEEVLSAIELLKSHGSTIKRSIAFNYDTDLFDIKYCFMYKRSKAESLEEGKSFFDRKIDEGEFRWFAVYDDIEIDDFMYTNYISDYDVMEIDYYGDSGIDRDFENVENTENLSFDWYGKGGDGYYMPNYEAPHRKTCDILYNGEIYCHLDFSETWIPDEYHEEFLSSFTIIE